MYLLWKECLVNVPGENSEKKATSTTIIIDQSIDL